jgi:threonine aldolase
MNPPVIDLRSDTVTRPTAAMRQAMATAEVGDDVYREDPTVRALEERVAALVGKEAALFVPSGTMANQIAIMLSTERGGEVLIGEGGHSAVYESGATAAWSGAQPLVVGRGGLFTAAELAAAIRPRTDYYPRSSLVVVENTHNAAGGRVFPQAEIARIAEVARAHGLALHLDGARLWNAAAASGLGPTAIAAPFDTVSTCLSKGLGAPVGSVLAGRRDFADRARRMRKMLGGGMRQAGILAAAGLYALDHHRGRLVEDHANARRLAEVLARSANVDLDLATVETNIVVFGVRGISDDELVSRARAAGVLVGLMGPGRVRAVTHLDVGEEDVDAAAEILLRIVGA